MGTSSGNAGPLLLTEKGIYIDYHRSRKGAHVATGPAKYREKLAAWKLCGKNARHSEWDTVYSMRLQTDAGLAPHQEIM